MVRLYDRDARLVADILERLVSTVNVSGDGLSLEQKLAELFEWLPAASVDPSDRERGRGTVRSLAAARLRSIVDAIGDQLQPRDA